MKTEPLHIANNAQEEMSAVAASNKSARVRKVILYRLVGTNKHTHARIMLKTEYSVRRVVKYYQQNVSMLIDNYEDLSIERITPLTLEGKPVYADA